MHPYEETQGFRRLLDIPGYDVAALVKKSGESASHVYARLSLLKLIPTVAEAFTQERITASHANLIARLPQESQAEAFEQCWRKDWQDKEAHLLPTKHVAAWIQDAGPVMPCEAKPAIVVYGEKLGRKLTVCTDQHCPVHDPHAVAEAAHPVPTMAPAPVIETQEKAAQLEAEHD